MMVIVIPADAVVSADVRCVRGGGRAFADECLDVRGSAVLVGCEPVGVDTIVYISTADRTDVIVIVAAPVVVQVDGTVFEIRQYATKFIEVEVGGVSSRDAAGLIMRLRLQLLDAAGLMMIMIGDSC